MASVVYDTASGNVRRYNQDNEGGKCKRIVIDYPQYLPNYLAPAVPSWKIPNAAVVATCGRGGGYFDDKGWWYPTLPTFHREMGGRIYYLDV